jgi:hypothetical protein
MNLIVWTSFAFGSIVPNAPRSIRNVDLHSLHFDDPLLWMRSDAQVNAQFNTTVKKIDINHAINHCLIRFYWAVVGSRRFRVEIRV